MSKTFIGLKLVRSQIGTHQNVRDTLRVLKLTHMNKKVYREVTPSTLGMINAVRIPFFLSLLSFEF